MTLESDLRELIREEVEAAVSDALEGVDQRGDGDGDEELRSRLWRMEPETRLPLADVAEILDCSERTVRRHAAGERAGPVLPMRDGPMGKVTTAGDLREWIRDAEQAARFREGAA